MSDYHCCEIYRRFAHAALCAAVFFAAFFVTLAPSQGAETQYAEELIFEIKHEPYLISAGVFGYELEGRYYFPLLELAEGYEFFVDSDLGRGYVSGWVGAPVNSFSIDTERMELIVRGVREPLSPDDILLDEDLATEDFYVSVSLLEKIWPLDFNVDLSLLTVSSEVEGDVELPFEKRFARKERQEALEFRRALKKKREDFPFVPNDYRMFSYPVLDIQGTYTFDNDTKQLTGDNNVSGIMHTGGFITDFSGSFAFDADGRIQRPRSIRWRMQREALDDEEGIWGTGLRDVKLGDVNLRQRDLIGTSTNGRGFFISNKYRDASGEFDRITVEGIGTPGWEIELYLNDTLIDFGEVDATGEYRFEDVVLQRGNNVVRVVLYGPQGQIREDVENYNFTGGQLKPGEFQYDIGLLDSGRPLFLLDNKPRTSPRGYAKTASAAYGLSRDLTVFGSFTDIPTDLGEKRYATAGAAFSLLNSSVRAEGYQEVNGGNALDLRFLTQLLGLQLNLRSAFFNKFESQDAGSGTGAKRFEGEARVSTRIPFFYFGNMGLRVNALHRETYDGRVTTDVTTSQSVAKKGWLVTHSTNSSFVNEIHDRSSGSLNVNYNYKDWQWRGAFNYQLHPVSELNTFQSSVRYSDSENPLQFAVSGQHSFLTDVSGAGVQVGYEFDRFLGSVDFNYLQEQGWDITARASSSLSPYNMNRQYEFASRPQRDQSPVLARVFLDRDNDGSFTEADEPIQYAKLLSDGRGSKEPSNKDGYVVISAAAATETNIELNEVSLEDPYFRSAKKGYRTTPLPGTMPTFEFPVIETGIVEGFVTYASDEQPVKGMIIQLVDINGEVVMESETAFDGYYAFEFVLPGIYTVRANPEYEVHVPPETVTVTSEDLFLYGIDLFLLEQADEVGATDGNPDVAGGEKSGDVAQTNHSTGTQPAPISSDSDFDAVVKYVRIGEYPGKGRLVLDLSGPADDYSVTLSDDGRAVLVDLPDVGWEADGLPDTTPISMIEGLDVESLENGKTGTRIRINASKLVTVDKHGILPPSEKWGTGYRLYLDVLTGNK